MRIGGARTKPIGDTGYSVNEEGVVLSPSGMSLSPVRETWVSIRGERKLVSYLTARAFVPNPEGRQWVRHRDGDMRNNRAENLCWSEEPEAKRKGGRKARMVRFGQFSVEGDMVAQYMTVGDAARATGLEPRAIRAALDRRGKSGRWYWMWL